MREKAPPSCPSRKETKRPLTDEYDALVGGPHRKIQTDGGVLVLPGYLCLSNIMNTAVDTYNSTYDHSSSVNQRQITNINLFRKWYNKHQSDIKTFINLNSQSIQPDNKNQLRAVEEVASVLRPTSDMVDSSRVSLLSHWLGFCREKQWVQVLDTNTHEVFYFSPNGGPIDRDVAMKCSLLIFEIFFKAINRTDMDNFLTNLKTSAIIPRITCHRPSLGSSFSNDPGREQGTKSATFKDPKIILIEGRIRALLASPHQLEQDFGLKLLRKNRSFWSHFSSTVVSLIINTLTKTKRANELLETFAVVAVRAKHHQFEPHDLALIAYGLAKCTNQQMIDNVLSTEFIEAVHCKLSQFESHDLAMIAYGFAKCTNQQAINNDFYTEFVEAVHSKLSQLKPHDLSMIANSFANCTNQQVRVKLFSAKFVNAVHSKLPQFKPQHLLMIVNSFAKCKNQQVRDILFSTEFVEAVHSRIPQFESHDSAMITMALEKRRGQQTNNTSPQLVC